MAGFIDAEGCFTAARRSGRDTYRMRVTIGQKGEPDLMQQLQKMNPEIEKWGHISKRANLYEVYTLDSLVQLKGMIEYLDKHQLRSQKQIAYVK